MVRNVVRTALVAGAGMMLSWALQAIFDKHRANRHRAHKDERKAAVSEWENEGGGLAPGHDPRL